MTPKHTIARSASEGFDTTNPYAGPAWLITSEYPGLNTDPWKTDLNRVQELRQQIRDNAAFLGEMLPRLTTSLSERDETAAVDKARAVFRDYEQAAVTLGNLQTFVSCELSVDGRNDAAKVVASQIAKFWAELDQATKPWELFLTLAPDATITRYLAHESTKSHAFSVEQARKLRDQLLTLPEEDLITGLGVDGHTAWGALYDNISGVLTATVDTAAGKKTLGLAAATSMYEDPDPKVRRAAFDGINAAWSTQDEACAAMLNAITGWRLEVYKRRSLKKPVHYLDRALHDSRITRQTLDAMMSAVAKDREVGQRAVRARAAALGLTGTYGPWDLFAPCTNLAGLKQIKSDSSGKGSGDGKMTFTAAIDLIAEAFGSIDPAMGEFVRMMQKNQWIEGRIGNAKRPGAYCTGFSKSRTPRVYMTFTGGMKDVMTLAHELGHAFHSWVMRDLPWSELHYPMTLAETASIFGETVVNGALAKRAGSPHDLLKVAWSDASEAEGFLCNIPARFQFESELFERRTKSNVTATELRDMMSRAWRDNYGDSLVQGNPMFWASKLHFYITEVSFYNFPYTFGYLFALGVYAQKEKLGKGFYPAYVSLLRDTGRMSAEEVAKRHLGADITRPDFWRESIAIARTKVERLESIVRELK